MRLKYRAHVIGGFALIAFLYGLIVAAENSPTTHHGQSQGELAPAKEFVSKPKLEEKPNLAKVQIATEDPPTTDHPKKEFTTTIGDETDHDEW